MDKIYALKDPETFEVKYIGQTSLTLYRRLTRHVSEALTHKKSSPKKEWIKSLIFKELCPIIELLEISDSPNKTEEYWINKYKETIFNIEEKPNFNKKNSKTVFGLLPETGNIIEFSNISEASEKTGTDRNNITKAIHSNKKANNFLWAYSKVFKSKERSIIQWILLTDVKTKNKYVFKTKLEAALFAGLSWVSSKNGITYALEHKDKEYKGYLWECVEEHLKFGELRENPIMDNPDPSIVNDSKVTMKEQRLTSEESTNNLDTSAEHQMYDLIKICLQTNYGSNADLMMR